MPQPLTSVEQLDFKPHGPVTPSPREWRDIFIYQLLIDRFDDNKDHPAYDPNTSKRGRDSKCACNFQGGKIKGITRRLDYIQSLGCNAIWVSPPFKNRQEQNDSCHGYGIQDFLNVDPRFGTLADLQELVREAHRRQMYVVLDIVINHTGDNWGYPDDKPEPFNEKGRYDFGFWRKRDGGRVPPGSEKELGPDDGVWPIELQHPDVYKRRGQIRNLAAPTPDEKVSGDFFSLKDLDITQPQVLDVMIKVYKHWIAATDIDGYRLDTIGHTEPGASAIFCNAIREYARSIGKDNFFLFAELVEQDDVLKNYVGGNLPVHHDERFPIFDACLDFPLYFVLEEVIKGFKSPKELRDRYEKFRHFYRDFSEAGKYFVTFVDNHDQMARPFRRFMNNVKDPKQGILAIGYLLSNMGIPCIYYGTEQGFDGGGDSDYYVRECMFGGCWGPFDTTDMQCFNPDHPIYKAVAKIARVRAEQRTLRYGREYFREISGNAKDFGHPMDGRCTLAFSRVLDTNEMLVCLNLDENKREDCVLVDGKLNPPGTKLRDLLDSATRTVEQTTDGRAYVRVPLAGHSMSILSRIP